VVSGIMKFIDLFAGLGGFHLALIALGHRCVFASEIREDLRELYKANFGFEPAGDVRNLAAKDIPKHDILTAGIPCQPFSKAGMQDGLQDRDRGLLYNAVIKILRTHRPKFFILENVPNLMKHNEGKTWRHIGRRLKSCGYEVDWRLLSPHQFGVPQIRERAFIVGARAGLREFEWPSTKDKSESSILDILDENPPDAVPLSKTAIARLRAWQKFLNLFPKDEQLPSFPIWTMEFMATYPYEKHTPYASSMRKLARYRGAYGEPLREVSPVERLAALPSYARTQECEFPDWKIKFIRQNREFYESHKKWLARWLPSVEGFPPSFQKFEWNCKGEKRRIWDFIIQFRPSGIRVKRPVTAPSLVAMTISQVPIIGWEKRFLTPREAARLQSMDHLRVLPQVPSRAYKALGNAVNVEVVKHLASALLEQRGRCPESCLKLSRGGG